jgi:hypothetical protein
MRSGAIRPAPTEPTALSNNFAVPLIISYPAFGVFNIQTYSRLM